MFRGLHAEEPEFHGPTLCIRLLVVKVDGLIRRVIRRGVDALGNFRAWRRAFAIFEQLSRDCFYKFFEVRDGFQLKSTKQYRSVLEQMCLDEFAVVSGPDSEIEIVYFGLDDKRKGVTGIQ